jgi:hypothetical protein
MSSQHFGHLRERSLRDLGNYGHFTAVTLGCRWFNHGYMKEPEMTALLGEAGGAGDENRTRVLSLGSVNANFRF